MERFTSFGMRTVKAISIAGRKDGRPERITHLDGDLSMPLWNFHAASYALLPGGKAYLSFVDRGETKSAVLDLGTGVLEPRKNGLTTATTLSAGAAGVALVGMTDEEALCVFRDEGSATGAPQIIRRSGTLDIDRAFVSRPARASRFRAGTARFTAFSIRPPIRTHMDRREEASPHHQPARRPDECGGARTEASNVVLYLARFLLARSGLCRQHRLWAGLSRPAERQLGCRGCRRYDQRGPIRGFGRSCRQHRRFS